jgi:hypothetical protein
MTPTSTPKTENTSATLRGYSSAAELREGEPPRVEEDPSSVVSVAKGVDGERGGARRHGRATRPLWMSAGALRPSSVAARGALVDVTSRCADIDQQLALVEMLFAVGPDGGDEGALGEALSGLEKIEDELAADLARLRRACNDVRVDGVSAGKRRP